MSETLQTGPLAGFETDIDVVFGESIPVFRNRAGSLRQLLVQSRERGDLEYLVFGAQRFSFASHFERVAAVAHALRDRHGVEKGDRVAILAANCPEWIVGFWAAVSLGAIVVGMNGWWTEDEIRFALDHSKPKLLIGDKKRLSRLRGDYGSVPTLEIESQFEELWAESQSELPPETIEEDDPAVILYTSGTTGRPKGAVNTHRNIIALLGLQSLHGARLAQKAIAAGRTLPTTQHCRLNASPLFHVSGLYSAAVAQLAAGFKSVWTEGRFAPQQILGLIERERVNGWAPMGSMAVRVLDEPSVTEHDLSSVQSIGCGGAPVPPDIQRRLVAAFPNAALGLTVGYGQTECTGLATMITGDQLAAHPTSVGKPLPTVSVEIRDEAGRAVDDGVEGEICIRSPLVMKEYFRDPEATSNALWPGRWLRTGDIGQMKDGRLYVSTRKRDLILRAAENVYPAEIEARLESHPRVLEAAVVGVDHRVLGQAVKAIIVPQEPGGWDVEELRGWVAETLAYYKVPDEWEERAEPLPRNASGKVMKWLLDPGAENPLSGDE